MVLFFLCPVAVVAADKGHEDEPSKRAEQLLPGQ